MFKGVDTFFRQIAPVQVAYRHQTFAYSALRTKEGFVVLKAALFLNPSAPNVPLAHFQSENVRAGHYSLEELGLDARALVDQVLSGTIATPRGPLLFRPRKDGSYAAIFDPIHPLGLRSQQRYAALTVTGGERPLVRQPSVDWEMKANAEPYFNLGEVLARHDLGALDPDRREQMVEVIAYGVAMVDSSSRVDNTRATIRLRVSDGLAREKVSLGYRVVQGRACLVRASIPDDQLEWSAGNGEQLAKAEIDVPAASVVDCIACYDGIARHHWWIGDPSRAQNSRRAAYEAVDPGLKIFSDYITKSGKNSRDQHDFESAVAWLVWMLGFSPAHLGGSKQLEAADLVVTTPSGDFAVVECTTGLLKAEHKLAHLVERTEAVRSRVSETHRVIPVIVTSKTRREVRAEIADAEKLGVLVVTRENLDDAALRTILMPDADATYEQAENAIGEALAKHQLQEELDLGNDVAPA
jgi:hypothetical protein